MSEVSKAAREAVSYLMDAAHLHKRLLLPEDADGMAIIIDQAMRPEREAAKELASECVEYLANQHRTGVDRGRLALALAAYRAATGEK